MRKGQKLSEYRVSLAEGRKEKSQLFDRVWFSRKTAVLDSRTMTAGSISRIDNDGEAQKT